MAHSSEKPGASNIKSKIAISVIIPVYNVEPYLDICLSSLLEQNFENTFEVLLINDQSTDNSSKICQEYAAKHPKIFRYYENDSNQGVSVTRNRGLELETGEYFMFVDPDDILTNTALSDLYDAARAHNADIVKGNNSILKSDREYPAKFNCNRQRLIQNLSVYTTLLIHEEVRGHPWGKLFRSDKFQHFRFPPGVKMAQDLLYCAEVFSAADSLYLLDKNVYRYRIRETGSKGKKYTTGSYIHWLDSVDKLEAYVSSNTHSNALLTLKVRTLEQLAGEAKKLPPGTTLEVTKEFGKRRKQWRLSLWSVTSNPSRIYVKTISRYIKAIIAISSITRKQRKLQ